MDKVNVAFGIHNHQPVGNFDFVFEEAYQKSYLPFLEILEKHPGIRLALHYSGILFQWIKTHEPEFIPRLRALVQAGQIEMMTGGFYEPILAVIPYRDKIGQIKKLTEFVRQHTRYNPKGMWLAERIWEPHLPKPCAETGVKYLVLDDSHFKNAGLQEEQLLGYYVTEEEGHTVYLFPISETLRYTIPFESPEKTIEFLRSIARSDRHPLVVFADDGEKFGVWPGTYDHCYKDGWLESFCRALEENSNWINIVHFSEALERIKPLGRIYLPTASYREMMEWAMPTKAINDYEEFEDILKRNQLYDKYKVFVRGGFWRNFMAKYPESNNMHKKMLHLSYRLAELETSHRSDENFEQAQDHLWAAQCNCPYWHGVFGGLYLNHLRYATYHELIQAERLVEALERTHLEQADGWSDYRAFDYDGDGLREIVIANKTLNLYFAPESGGSLFELDFKPRAINLLDTMTRREESYHKKLRQINQQAQKRPDHVASIHDQVMAKEEGLEDFLFYDWYRRSSLLDHFLCEGTTVESFARCNYEEAGDFINSPYEFACEKQNGGLLLRLWRNGHVMSDDSSVPVYLEKRVFVNNFGGDIHISYAIKNSGVEACDFWFGVELDFALLAGDAQDRYFVFPGHRLDDSRLRSTGEVANSNEVVLKDEWLKLKVALRTEKPGDFWRFPIETISQSEGGFERIYQSSVVVPHWKIKVGAGQTWENDMTLSVEAL